VSDPDILRQLLQLLAELTADSEGYLEREDDAQLWYNRGYANGIAAALTELGHGEAVARTVEPDPYERARDQQHLPWGKAYEHGREMGTRETDEIMSIDPVAGARN
jgi:hypothetical protein